MNTFSVYIYDNADKKWNAINNVVFPLGTGNFLDERLDEAYLTWYDDTPHYESGAIFKIVLVEGDDAEQVTYYVLDSDSSINVKVGAALYRHTAHLLEPTKLLEGVLCQSLAFTNDLGSNTIGELTNFTQLPSNNPYVSKINFRRWNPYPSPIKDGTDLTILAPYPFFYQLSELIKGVEPDIDYLSGLNGTCTITIKEGSSTTTEILDGNSANYTVSNISDQAHIKLTYTLSYQIHFNGYYEDYEDEVYSISIYATKIYYPTRPYTITEMTNRCLMLAEPRYFNTTKEELCTPRFRFDGCTYGFWGSTSFAANSQAEYYDTVFADELTLSGATLREQLKGIARLIHAEPRVYITENNVGEQTLLKYWVRYDKYGIGEETTVSKPYTYRALSQSINEYCTEIRTNAANLVNSLDYAVGVISDPLPAGNDRGVRSLRTDTIGVRIGADNGIAETANPIYKPTMVECGIMSSDGIYRVPLTNITPFVIEKAAYELLTAYGTTYPTSKAYAIYYTQGEPNISGLFFRAAVPSGNIYQIFNNYAIVNILAASTGINAETIRGYISSYGETSLVFRTSYIPMYSTTLAHSKQLWTQGEMPYAQIYAQSENIIEARYYGENIKGTVAKLGNVSEERTYILAKRSEAPKIGQMLGEYSVASVMCETFPDFTKCTIALSRDYNRINEYVGINSHKRIYEVSEREAYNRDVLIHEHIVLSREERFIESDEYCICETPEIALQSFTDGSTPNQISNVISEMYPGGTFPNPDPISSVSLPVISSAFGNAMVFTWKYKDNFAAGQSTEYVASGDISGRWGVNVEYGDRYGRAEKCAFYLFNKSILPAEASSPDKYAYYTPDILGKDSELIDYVKSEAIMRTSAKYFIKKDSREIISTINYELEFRTTEPDLIIGSGIASANGLVTTRRENCYFYPLKNKPNKFMRKIDISDLLTDENGNPIMQIPHDRISITGNTISFPKNDSRLTVYWVLATELREVSRGPFVFPNGTTQTVTEWAGGDVILACSSAVEAGRILYPALNVTIHHQ